MAVFMALDWHEGERQMHHLLKVPEYDNPVSPGLTPQAAFGLQKFPLLAIGTLDEHGRPWTSLWGGDSGFSSPLGGGIVGVRTAVDINNDPVVKSLLGGKGGDGESFKAEGEGQVVSGLAIDLMARKRVKIAGRFIAGSFKAVDSDEDRPGTRGEADAQAVIRITESLGNCPKYLNKRLITPAPLDPEPQDPSPILSEEALDLLKKADMFFMSSSQAGKTMDTNHRGGPSGFARVISNSKEGAEIIWPEYSGNRLYQSLGNLMVTPQAGLTFPDYENGNVLYLTGKTEILVGADAASILPRSNLAVKLIVSEARFVFKGLAFRGSRPADTSHGMSPYNPDIRLLTSEGNIASKIHGNANIAKLVDKESVTQTITRYKFELNSAESFQAGQWVALDFSSELDMGYSHMDDEDPMSLNDDFVRTFTVSSPPSTADVKQTTFELTVRQHGPVTGFLTKQSARGGLELPLKGFGGEFVISTPENGGVVPFIAGGVGITPLLGQLNTLNLERVRLFWIIRINDVKFVLDVLHREPSLAASATIFLTGASSNGLTTHQEEGVDQIKALGARTLLRRPESGDFKRGSDVVNVDDAEKWYLCAGRPLRDHLLEWLEGRTVVYENFDY